MMDKFLSQETCSRCGGGLNVRVMSMFNEEVICVNCKDEERKHPRYKEALSEELAHLRRGNCNYPGLFAGQKYPFEEK